MYKNSVLPHREHNLWGVKSSEVMLFVKINGVVVWYRRIRKYAALEKFRFYKCYHRWFIFYINELRKVNRLITFNIKDIFLYVGEKVGSSHIEEKNHESK